MGHVDLLSGAGQPPARLLVVDASTSELDSYRTVLAPAAPAAQAPGAGAAQPAFMVDYLQDGEQACRQVLAARDEDRPDSVAFVDPRMPGGWDGMQTIDALWQADPRIQVVMSTAVSGHSWESVTSRLGVSTGCSSCASRSRPPTIR